MLTKPNRTAAKSWLGTDNFSHVNIFLTVGILVRIKARKIRNPILNSRERKRLSGMDKSLLSDTVNKRVL